MTQMEDSPMLANQKPEKGQFYVLRPDVRGGGPGHNVEIENIDVLLTPPSRILRPAEGGIPPLRETPRLVHGAGKNKPPRDLEGGFSGYWLVSERLKEVLESVDPGAFEFAICDYVLPDGSQGPTHYLCDVVRQLAALDKPRSKYKVTLAHDHETGKDVEMLSVTGGAELAFLPEVVGSAHIFRMSERPSIVACDAFLRSETRKAGVGVKPSSDGLLFTDAATY
ncbi:DUF1629 domain-containing protein [Xanthomonas hortorum]|uniref:DUF1629 domain-containing protein n=1 Tax=Xanthomonas hortorum TaxID=56454 RepID=UPI001F380DE0|nr:DUF1629 domain-containing protein [Xanthomonas hortorum]